MWRGVFWCVCLSSMLLTSDGQDEEIKVWLTTPSDRKNLLKRQAGLTWSNSDQSTSEHVVDIDDSVSYQEIDGFGATLSDSSAWLIREKMDLEKRQKLLTSLFDRHRGIGLNTIRLAIGPSSFSRSNRTYADTCCALDKFDIAPDKGNLIPVLTSARKINADVLIFALNWSPPSWMKVGDSLIGGQLKSDQFNNLGTYFTKFVLEYAKANIPVYALIVQNEPQYRSCCYPSMWMDADEQAYFISQVLKKVFDKYRLNTKIIASVNNWDILNTYGSEILRNEKAREAVAGIAFQCYRGSPSEQTKFREEFPDKDLWLMECTDEVDGKVENQFEFQFRRAMNRELIGSFRNYARAVMKSNLILSHRYGPRNGGCSNCVGMVTLNTKTNKLVYNAAYYAYGHLSKFVRKGAKRIQSTTTTVFTMETVAFKNPNGDNVLLVYNNLKDYPVIFKAQWDGRFFAYSLPPSSAATFVWKGRAKPRSAFQRIEAESFSLSKSVSVVNCNDTSGCGASVKCTETGGYLVFKKLDFGTGANSVTFRSFGQSNGSFLIELRIDNMRDAKNLIGLIIPDNRGNGAWMTKSWDTNKVQGVHDLYVILKGNVENINTFNWLVFSTVEKEFYEIPVEVNQDHFYKIVARLSDKSLDVDNRDRQNNTPVQQWDYYYVDWQRFHFQKSNFKDCYKIFVKNSGMALEASIEGSGQRMLVRQKPYDGGSKKSWKFLRTKDGYFNIVSCDNNLVMEIENGKLENGALVGLAKYQPSKLEQTFSLVLVEPFPLETNVTEFERRKLGVPL